MCPKRIGYARSAMRIVDPVAVDDKFILIFSGLERNLGQPIALAVFLGKQLTGVPVIETPGKYDLLGSGSI
jgi:hypothetical protein